MLCCVSECHNGKKAATPGVEFIQFPKSEKQRVIWAKLAGIESISPSLLESLWICSEHFFPNCNYKIARGLIPTRKLPGPSQNCPQNLIDQGKLQSHLKSHLMSLVLKDQKNSVDLTQSFQKELKKGLTVPDDKPEDGKKPASSGGIGDKTDKVAERNGIGKETDDSSILSTEDLQSKKIVFFVPKDMLLKEGNVNVSNKEKSSKTLERNHYTMVESSLADIVEGVGPLTSEAPKILNEKPKTAVLQSVSNPPKPVKSAVTVYSRKLSKKSPGLPNILRHRSTNVIKLRSLGIGVIPSLPEMPNAKAVESALKEAQKSSEKKSEPQNGGLGIVGKPGSKKSNFSPVSSGDITNTTSSQGQYPQKEIDGLDVLDDEHCYLLDPVTAAQLEKELPDLLNVDNESDVIPIDTKKCGRSKNTTTIGLLRTPTPTPEMHAESDCEPSDEINWTEDSRRHRTDGINQDLRPDTVDEVEEELRPDQVDEVEEELRPDRVDEVEEDLRPNMVDEEEKELRRDIVREPMRGPQRMTSLRSAPESRSSPPNSVDDISINHVTEVKSSPSHDIEVTFANNATGVKSSPRLVTDVMFGDHSTDVKSSPPDDIEVMFANKATDVKSSPRVTDAVFGNLATDVKSSPPYVTDVTDEFISANSTTAVKSSPPNYFSSTKKWCYTVPDKMAQDCGEVPHSKKRCINNNSPDKTSEVLPKKTRLASSMFTKIPYVVLERLPDHLVPGYRGTVETTTHFSEVPEKRRMKRPGRKRKKINNTEQSTSDFMGEHDYAKKTPRLRCISPARLFPKTGENDGTKKKTRNDSQIFCDTGNIYGVTRPVKKVSAKLQKSDKISRHPIRPRVHLMLASGDLSTLPPPLDLFNFTVDDSTSSWVESSDTVRDVGMSKATLVFHKSRMFQRAVFFTMLQPQPNGAGFAGVNCEKLLNLSDATTISLLVRGQGNVTGYKMVLRHKLQNREPYPSYEQFFTVPTDKFDTVNLPLDNFLPYYRGKPSNTSEPLDKSFITSIGLQVYGGVYSPIKQSGVSALEINWIRAS